jgi:RNA recognition motif-containing protein
LSDDSGDDDDIGLDKFRSIFVGNLPDNAHEAAVEQLFSKFGAVLDVAVKQGSCRSFSQVLFLLVASDIVLTF